MFVGNVLRFAAYFPFFSVDFPPAFLYNIENVKAAGEESVRPPEEDIFHG